MDGIRQRDQGVTPLGSGSQASPEAASASSPSVSIPNAAWLAWPSETDFQELEVELLFREGTTYTTLASDFDYWWHRSGQDLCDDVIAFRIVGLSTVDDEEAHRRAADFQRRHGYFDPAIKYGHVAQAIEARSAATGTGAVEDESAVGNADAPDLSQPLDPKGQQP